MSVPWSEIAAHRERLVRVAMRRVPTREDAEDVVSEAMLRCATFDRLDPARLGQFLTTVTVRLCADLHRDAERGLRLVRRLDHDLQPSPEELACAAADAHTLHELLCTLPDRQREVLVDRASGMSVTQISGRHALTYKAAESALARARAQMRVALAAAMSLVWAFADFVRRRPVVEASLPVVSVAMAVTVLAPFAPPGGDRAPSAAGPAARVRPPAVQVDAGRAIAAVPATRAEALRPRPVAVPAWASAPRPAQAPAPRPSKTYLEVGQGPNRTVVSDDDDSLREEIDTCRRNGPQARFTPSPGAPFVRMYVGCDPE